MGHAGFGPWLVWAIQARGVCVWLEMEVAGRCPYNPGGIIVMAIYKKWLHGARGRYQSGIRPIAIVSIPHSVLRPLMIPFSRVIAADDRHCCDSLEWPLGVVVVKSTTAV